MDPQLEQPVQTLRHYEKIYKQSSMDLKEMQALRGTEKRKLEKQLRMARIASRLMSQHVEKQRELARLERELAEQEEQSPYIFAAHHTKVRWVEVVGA